MRVFKGSLCIVVSDVGRLVDRMSYGDIVHFLQSNYIYAESTNGSRRFWQIVNMLDVTAGLDIVRAESKRERQRSKNYA